LNNLKWKNRKSFHCSSLQINQDQPSLNQNQLIMVA